MTTVTPPEVWYEYEAYISGLLPVTYLPVRNMVVSMDRDRRNMCEARLDLDWVDDATFAALDPRTPDDDRTGAQVSWRIFQHSGDYDDPDTVSWLPVTTGAIRADMYVRTATRDYIDRTTTLILAGGESYLEDKKRNAAAPIDTGATAVSSLVLWSLVDVFAGAITSFAPILAATDLPAGDRRKMFPKESHFELLKPELDAIGCRLYDYWGRQWRATLRSTVSGTLKLATYEGVPDTDPIVYELIETLSRDGDWADGVLIEYNQPDGDTAYQVSGAGANTRSLVLSRDRPAPAANAAEEVAARAITRGYDLLIVARIRFDIDPFMNVEVHTPDGVLTARIRSIEWDVAASQMTIRAQAGEPEE